MLVLTRKINESIMLGSDIELVITEISPTQVRIGIKAPQNLEILRKEIYDAVTEENRKAAHSNRSGKQLEEELKKFLKKGVPDAKKGKV